MRFLITGEQGFIGRNLARVIQEMGHEFVPICTSTDNPNLEVVRQHLRRYHLQPGERPVPCVHRNSSEEWAQLLEALDIDVVVHNAAVVGTDVVGLNLDEATLTNVLGTRNIVEAVNAAGIPVCYLGTSVIYDVGRYQEVAIVEDDDRKPPTYYGALKLAGEQIVQSAANRWNVLRPLFAYGGDGDMNSLIAKTFYAHLTGRESLDMFLNPDKIKDYIYVDDFCRAIVISCVDGHWGTDFNVAAETPVPVNQIVEVMEDVLTDAGLLPVDVLGPNGLSQMLQWKPETDYLGNHRMTSRKFTEASGWSPEVNMYEGLERVLKSIQTAVATSNRYNPLRFLDQAERDGVDLEGFFPDKV